MSWNPHWGVEPTRVWSSTGQSRADQQERGLAPELPHSCVFTACYSIIELLALNKLSFFTAPQTEDSFLLVFKLVPPIMVDTLHQGAVLNSC